MDASEYSVEVLSQRGFLEGERSPVEQAFADRAAGGERVPAEAVVAVLRASGLLAVTEADVCEAAPVVLRRTWSEVAAQSEGLNLAEVTELWGCLRPAVDAEAVEPEPCMCSPVVRWARGALRSSLWCWPCKAKTPRRKNQEEFGGKLKPTTRLLLVIVLIALVVALSVVGLAIGLSWVADMQSQNEALQKELDLVMSAVQSFSVTQAQAQEERSSQNTAAMLVNII
eukprot:RCo017438